MTQASHFPVSRGVIRAVLETRDHRHNETHAMLLALFQGLVTELVQQGSVDASALADRLALADAKIRADAHGEPARDMLAHVVDWLRAQKSDLPPTHPDRWFAPPPE